MKILGTASLGFNFAGYYKKECDTRNLKGKYIQKCESEYQKLKCVYSWNKTWSLKNLALLKCESRIAYTLFLCMCTNTCKLSTQNKLIK